MKKASRMAIRPALLALLIVFLASGLGACGGSSSPPGADKAMGLVDRGGYLFLRWQEGLEIMIWHDIMGEGTGHSAGSTAGRLYVERGGARSADGRSLSWEVETADGRVGELRIDGVRYDLAAGNLFIATTQAGTAAVRQLRRDLSAVPLDRDGILAFARNDPDLAAFFGESREAALPAATATPPAPTAAVTGSATPTRRMASSAEAPATPWPPTAPPSVTATPTPAATLAATANSDPPAPAVVASWPNWVPVSAPAVERIRFAPGATHAIIDGYLPEDGRARYVMGVAAGQFVEMDATTGAMGPGLRFSIVGADGFVVKCMGAAHVRTVVPSTQDYYVELASDVGATGYRLSLVIPVRIRFARGAISATVTGRLEEGQMRQYVLRALAGQRLNVAPHAAVGQVRLVISGVDGQVLLSGCAGPPGGVFESLLPATQDYLIAVQAEGGTGADYNLEITIPPGVEPGITIEGAVMDAAPSARTIRLAEPVREFTVVVLTAAGRVLDPGGHPILMRALRPGMRIRASGRSGTPGVLIADRVLVLAN